MAKQKNSGLGRGLDAIFLDNSPEEGAGGGVVMARISEVEPRADQPRRQFEQASLASLAESIAANGVIQPIVVRPAKDGGYSIIAGERRWRAAKMAGLSEVPVVVTEADDLRASQLALIENIQREDLNPLEEAGAYKRLLGEYGMTQEQLSRSVGRSRSAIANSMRLLELPEDIRAMVADGRLTEGHARALLGLDRPEDMAPAAKKISDGGLSVRAAEELVRTLNHLAAEESESAEDETDAVKVDYPRELSMRLTERLGRRVTVREGKRSKTVTIEYEDNADLDEVIKLLCGDAGVADGEAL